MTPLILLGNIREFLSARNLPEPSLMNLNVPIGTPLPRVSAGPFVLKLAVGLTAWTLILGAVASRQVPLIEKHFPKLNALLHSGEVADESDAEYVYGKAFGDVNGLEQEIKSTGWDNVRAEILARQPILDDLNQQNGRIQRRIALERSQNLGAGDPCEKWALDELGPALDRYTRAQNTLFAMTRNTPKLNSETSGALDAASKSQEDSRAALAKAISATSGPPCGGTK